MKALMLFQAVSYLLFLSLIGAQSTSKSDPYATTVIVNGVEVPREIIEIRNSSAVNKTLIRDYVTGTKLTYSFYTSLEEYNDGTSHSFLVSDIMLHDVNTYALTDSSSIRITIGWRNPQEDAYDYTGLNFDYNENWKVVSATASDGYGFGNVKTEYYDKKKQVDADGNYNTTVEQWTNFEFPDPKSKLEYRKPEKNDVKIVHFTVSPRLDYGVDAIPGILPTEVKQTFSAQVRRPFQASELSDVQLLPLMKYNITSAYGCYQLDKKGISGTDGSTHFNPKDKKLGPYGCQFKWQAEEGAVIHDDPKKGVVAT